MGPRLAETPAGLTDLIESGAPGRHGASIRGNAHVPRDLIDTDLRLGVGAGVLKRNPGVNSVAAWIRFSRSSTVRQLQAATARSVASVTHA